MITEATEQSSSAELVRHLSGIETERNYKRGQFIYYAGGESRYLMRLVSGTARLVCDTLDGSPGVTVLLMPGDMFGLEVLAGGDTLRQFSAETLTPCTIAMAHSVEIANLRSLNSYLDGLLLKESICLSMNMCEFVMMLSYPVPARVAMMINRLAPLFADGRMPRWLNQGLIGELVGTTRVSVNKAIALLMRAGLLEKIGGRTKSNGLIVDRKALRSYVERGFVEVASS